MSDPVAEVALAVVIVGLALSTFVTRTFVPARGGEIVPGHRVEVALRYAPVCTLAAIIVPTSSSTLRDTRSTVATQSPTHRRDWPRSCGFLVAKYC
jgi:branched-subunit amino acid transport protein